MDSAVWRTNRNDATVRVHLKLTIMEADILATKFTVNTYIVDKAFQVRHGEDNRQLISNCSLTPAQFDVAFRICLQEADNFSQLTSQSHPKMSTAMEVIMDKAVKLGSIFSACKSLPAFFGYLLMIFGARLWIKISKPLELRKVLIVYNFLCTALSAYSIFLFCVAYVDPNLSHIFQRKTTQMFTEAFFVYHTLKWIEMLDTVFMILRHRQRQISFLHVFHHSSMLLLSDVAYYSYPWPSIAFYMTLNSFVHVWLYLYYALSAAFPDNPPQWKKQMTQLQIFQFFVGFLYSGYGYFYHNFCIYGPFYGIILTSLFCNFYYQAYMKKRSYSRKEDVKKQR